MSIDPQKTNQTGGGLTTNETSNCVTEEEAINGNLRVYNLPAADKTKFDPLQFLRSNYDKVKKILRAVLLKRQSVKWYLTMQARFKKRKERSDGNGGTPFTWTLSCCLKSRRFGTKPTRQQQEDYDVISRVSETG